MRMIHRLGVVLFACALVPVGFRPALAAPAASAAPDTSFAWYAQFVGLDQAAKAVTAKAPIEAHVARYIARFKPGDAIVLVWQQFGGEGDAVKYVTAADAMAADAGFVVRAEYVSADPAGRTLTFKTPVAEGVAKALAAAKPGTPMKVRSAMVLTTQRTAAATVALNEMPKARPAPKVEVNEAAARAAKVGGQWNLATSVMGNALKLACDITQQGEKLGGKCTGPGPFGTVELTGGVDGTAVTFQFEVTSFGPKLVFLHRGEVDAAGTAIKGMLNMMGNDSPFTMAKQ